MIISNYFLWSLISMPTLAIWVISPDLMGLVLISSTCFLSVSSGRGIWLWWAISWDTNAMPVAPQSISAFVCFSWLLMVNVQGITKCYSSIDPSNTSTLLTERHENPKYFKALKKQLFLSFNELSCCDWHCLFPLPWNLPGLILLFLLLQPSRKSKLISSSHNLPLCG